MASETYVHDGSSFNEATQIYVNVGGTFKEVDEGYANVSGTYKLVFSAFTATSFVTLSPGTGSFAVPANANAIHIQSAVGAGGGAVRGADYDKAGGESSGAGGGSGAYVSDKVFSVSDSETMSYAVGSGGAAGNGSHLNAIASDGTATTLSGSSTGTLFTLNGGGGSRGTGGGAQGPLRTNVAGTAGTGTVATGLTTGIFKDSDGTNKNVNTLSGGPTGAFNDNGDGVIGQNLGNCGGDNCKINGSNGGSSFNGNIAGGAGGNTSARTNGSPGTRGSGGGGGGGQLSGGGNTLGGAGGNGEIVYRFLKVR